MKQFLILFAFVFININSYAQRAFKKGYYIDNSGQKISCLIQNITSRNNPSDFKYKKSKEDKTRTITIKDVREFGIYDMFKYIRSNLDIDRSSSKLNELTISKEPIFRKETLFLKVVIEGKASLYSYIDNSLVRFFYKKDNTTIEQLVYKMYTIDNGRQRISKNKMFKSQVWAALECPMIRIKALHDLKYKEESLANFFIKYNEYHKSTYFFFQKEKTKPLHLALRPRINYASLDIESTNFPGLNTSFGSKMTFGIGAEMEYTLSFNKKRWALFIEAAYLSYKETNELIPANNRFGANTATINYQALEVPFGLRYSFFLNENSKFFINPFFMVVTNYESPLVYSPIPFFMNYTLTFDNISYDGGIGIGYKNNQYSAEIRYMIGRDTFSPSLLWSAKYRSISFILGYSFF